jgi:hypothetical protein
MKVRADNVSSLSWPGETPLGMTLWADICHSKSRNVAIKIGRRELKVYLKFYVSTFILPAAY